MRNEKRARIITALSGLVDLISDGKGEVVFIARIRSDNMDEIAVVGSELEELEDDGTTEPDLGWR